MYKWEKFSKPRVYSRSQRVTTHDDVQNWLKTVEKASDSAINTTFRNDLPKSKKSNTVRSAIDDVHLHDASYIEAKELLDEWVNAKVDLTAENMDMPPPVPKKTSYDIKKEWDHLLEANGEEAPQQEEEYWARYVNAYKPSTDPYGILEEPTEVVVDDILQDMLNKDLVPEEVTDDLGLVDHKRDGHGADPRVKMQLRHQQVKTNREKREKEKQQRLEEQRKKKEAHFKARQIVQKEEVKKQQKEKDEEKKIKKLMSEIRQEMNDDRKKKKIEKQKELQAHLEQQRAAELYEASTARSAKSLVFNEEVERQRKITEMIRLADQRRATHNMQLLQRCFSAWYDVVIERRLAMGKARAMADWKCLLKAWNAWRNYTRCRKVDEETWKHELWLREMHRLQTAARTHYEHTLMKKHLEMWKLYVVNVHREQELAAARRATQQKMAAFLSVAAQSGAARECDDDGEDSENSDSWSKSEPSTTGKIDALFSSPTIKQSASKPTVKHKKKNNPNSNSTRPAEAFQVKRKHASLTKEELRRLAAKKESSDEPEPRATSSGDGSKPRQAWQRAPFVVQNFENRHNAQQRILTNQQKQIAEQQKLITEMQYLQKQQMLQQQLVQEQLKNTGATELQKHLVNLQKDLKTRAEEITQSARSGGVESGCHEQGDTARDTARSELTLVTGRSDLQSNVTTARTDKSSTAGTPTGSGRHAKFVHAMEQRAAERTRLKKEREEKKRQQEAEKLRQLEAEQDEIRQKELAEKQARVRQHREKKRLEEQRARAKQEETARLQEQYTVAKHHSDHACMLYRAWFPWRRLMQIKYLNIHTAEQHHHSALQRKMLIAWYTKVSEDLREKRDLADKMYQYILVRRYFSNWKKVKETAAIAEEKAARFHETRTKSRILLGWADYAAQEKVAMWRKERIARQHNQRRIVLTAFRVWKKYPEQRREAEKREQRRSEMRRKVASMLSDYTPDEQKISDMFD